MTNKKITELTKVTSLGANSLLTAVDPNRSVGDQNVSIELSDLGGDASFDVEVNQVSHGLNVGDVIQHNGTS